MTQQKALLLGEKGGPFEVGTTDIPKPESGDVLVKIMSTALNPVDWKIQKHGTIVEKYPAIVGTDVAGVIEEVGEGVTAFKKGDRVLHQGLFQNDKASFQQYTTVPAEIVAKIPDNITCDQAASVPLGSSTAAVGFYSPADNGGAGLTPSWEPSGKGKYKGQSIVIFGGSSSVGQYAIQFARLSGFSTIVTTASSHNTALLKSLGATHIIDRKADFVAEAEKIFSSAPKPSIVYDAIALDTQELGWKILAPGGKMILVLPPRPEIKVGEDGKTVVNFFGNVHIHRDVGRSLYAKMTELLQSGDLKPNNVEVLPGGLAGIPAGLKRLEENKVSGVKLIARPQETV